MSSFARVALPIGLAVGFGVWNAYYVLEPALKEEEEKRQQRIAKQDQQLDKFRKAEGLAQQKTLGTDTPYNR
ncbi:hypothetical protein F4811DRAFT_203812 [Daldinia bambusicola]|nr:hypothetical protein F4811DRAFT_203812 [Daldinia bambusicola]